MNENKNNLASFNDLPLFLELKQTLESVGVRL